MKRATVVMLWAAVALAKEPLVPVVVAAVDIKAGTTVTFEMISQRSAEASMVTSSIVKPDSASYIINQKTRFPILAGDVVLWSFFETKASDEVATRCAAAVVAPESAQAQVGRHRDVVKKK